MRTERILLVATLAGLLCMANTARSAAEKQPDYLKLVRSYADALLEHGRDTYGEVKSPLIASALDRKTLTLIDRDLGRIEGIRNGDRSLYGANPMHDEDLYQTLYALTDVTGDKKYAQEADNALKWFFENCQSPVTGLMAWGEHIGWGFKTETLAFARGDNHEFFGAWVLWDKSFDLAPQPCIRFAHGLWDHQINEHSGEFSRHASWTKHAPGTQNEYPRHGGFYIAAWARAYEADKDPVFLKAIETLVDYFNKNSSPQTGAIPCSTNPSRLEIMWPESNLSLAVDLWDGADKVPDDLARKMRQRALRTDEVYLSLAHDFTPNGKGFVAGANVHTLERLTEGPWTDTAIWATGYGKATDAQIAMLCYLRYQQVKMDGYRKLVLDSASRYLYTEPDTNITLYPGSMAESIFHMLAAYDLTGQRYYLDRADYFARQAVSIFLDDSSPLPRASSAHDHYETITGGDDLMAALLKLWVAENQPEKKIRIVYNHR
ncbi:MAG TPA: hypothetical protein VMX13_14480 [Sedimentisphaerales bacterium]|nr:hypothetical protein [Sedimentisphaerales bacterium]